MIRKTMFSILSALTIAMLAMTASAQNANKKESITGTSGKGSLIDEKKESEFGQKKQSLTVLIQSVIKNDLGARKNTGGKMRNVPVNFVWQCISQGNANLNDLVAELVTRNTDGSTTRVSKKLTELKANSTVNTQLDLPMPAGVFAKDFKLTLKGSFRKEGIAELQPVSVVKSGSFPAVIEK